MRCTQRSLAQSSRFDARFPRSPEDGCDAVEGALRPTWAKERKTIRAGRCLYFCPLRNEQVKVCFYLFMYRAHSLLWRKEASFFLLQAAYAASSAFESAFSCALPLMSMATVSVQIRRLIIMSILSGFDKDTAILIIALVFRIGIGL